MKKIFLSFLKRFKFYSSIIKIYFYIKSFLDVGFFRFQKYDVVFYNYFHSHLQASENLIKVCHSCGMNVLVINKFQTTNFFIKDKFTNPKFLSLRNQHILDHIYTKIIFTSYLGLNLSSKRNKIIVHLLVSLAGLQGVYSINAFDNFDYIIISSPNQINDFKIWTIENPVLKDKILIPGGYPKLDSIIRKLSQHNIKDFLKSIRVIYAPTHVYSVNKKIASLRNNGLEIVSKLIKEGFYVIFRPHPTSFLDIEDNKVINSILEKHSSNVNFKFDNYSDYFDSYNESTVMVSDVSGTGFTFSLGFLKPTVFFVESIEAEVDMEGFHFFDRVFIGGVARSMDELVDLINKLSKLDYTNRLKKYREDNIFNVEKSDEYLLDSLALILNQKISHDWIRL